MEIDQEQHNSNIIAPPVLEVSVTDTVGMNSLHVAKKATRGAVALAARQVLVYGSNIGGSIILARILPADQFGYYAMVVFAVNFLSIFGGTGFASSLIRVPTAPSLEEKQAVFTAQELIICLVFGSLWIASPHLAGLYHLDHHGSLFFRLMGVALVLTSLMVIPQVQMERDLDFDRLAVIEASQAVIFNVVAIIMAIRGFGYISFAFALLIRTAAGAALALIMSPWTLRFRWGAPMLKEHLHFGISLQISQLLVVTRDSLTPIFIGIFLGVADVGYITWAWLVTAYAVLVISPLQRLYLPLFARVQHDRRELVKFVDATLWAVNVISAPLTMITLGLLHPLVIVVFGVKWLYAMPLVYYISSGNLFIPSASPIFAVLNAVGKSKTTLYYTALSVLVTWSLGVACTMKWGIWGFGYATIGCSLLNFVLYWIAWRSLGVNALKAYWPSWPVAVIAGLVTKLLAHAYFPRNLAELVSYGILGLVCYGIGLWCLSSGKFKAMLSMLRSNKKTDDGVFVAT